MVPLRGKYNQRLRANPFDSKVTFSDFYSLKRDRLSYEEQETVISLPRRTKVSHSSCPYSNRKSYDCKPKTFD